MAVRSRRRGFVATVALVAADLVPTHAQGAADRIELVAEVSRAGAKIDRKLFAQFAEHLGRGSVNSCDAPATVSPKPAATKIKGDHVSMTLPPKSVTVLGVRP